MTDLERANARVAAAERELETAKQSHERPSFSSQKVNLDFSRCPSLYLALGHGHHRAGG